MIDIAAFFLEKLKWLRDNRLPIILTLSCAGLVCVFLFLYYGVPVMNNGPEQPIAFSHRIHSGVKEIQCRFCHPYVGRSTFPGIPPVEKCLYCHNYIIAEHPEIKKEHDYFDKKTPIPWVKVNYIPEHVFFNHQPHIKKNIDCIECHGDVEAMDRLKDADFLMSFCVDCHQLKEAKVDCWLACHN